MHLFASSSRFFFALAGLTIFLSANCRGDVFANFDSLTFTGTSVTVMTAADLNAVTTGGTWFMPGRGASYEAQRDATGDVAILGDDLDGNAGTITLMAVTATAGNEVNLLTNDALFEFSTATRRTGNNKGLRYQFVDQSGNAVLATIDWNHNNNQLILNGGTPVNIGSEGFSSSNLGDTWDSTDARIRDVSVVFSAGMVTATFGSTTLSDTLLDTTATDVGRLRVQTIGTSGAAKGAYLSNVSLTSQPTTACILADVDMNGIVDFNDIPVFVTVLLGNMFQCEADCDVNGIVDFNDIPEFVNILLNP